MTGVAGVSTVAGPTPFPSIRVRVTASSIGSVTTTPTPGATAEPGDLFCSWVSLTVFVRGPGGPPVPTETPDSP